MSWCILQYHENAGVCFVTQNHNRQGEATTPTNKHFSGSHN
jgi:hypothetical protein